METALMQAMAPVYHQPSPRNLYEDDDLDIQYDLPSGEEVADDYADAGEDASSSEEDVFNQR